MIDFEIPPGTKLVTSDGWSVLDPEERARRERGATRLKLRLLSVPYYAESAKDDGDEYWAKFYDSRVKS